MTEITPPVKWTVRVSSPRPRMLFNSPLYGAFLVATFAVFWILRRASRARPLPHRGELRFYFYGTFDAAATSRSRSRRSAGARCARHHLRRQLARLLHRPRARQDPAPARASRSFSCRCLLPRRPVDLQILEFGADTVADVTRALGLHVKVTHLRCAAVRDLVLHVRDDELHDRRLPP